jgi:hypothetical protein
VTADIIIAADGWFRKSFILTWHWSAIGVKSVARKVVLGGTDKPATMTGFAAYRSTVDVNRMKEDPEIAWLLERPSLNIWSVSQTFLLG